eukprot:TRINITY_DN18011_c0_g1_i2.p1 TRINITY_DN18011_c0_g1~~TRINITY_DN18011_c0_g1_i2.p1  ORF type:complete len:180 (-),score=5.70 TRINITY_DN18011_c0_g1_i2:65-604(-)
MDLVGYNASFFTSTRASDGVVFALNEVLRRNSPNASFVNVSNVSNVLTMPRANHSSVYSLVLTIQVDDTYSGVFTSVPQNAFLNMSCGQLESQVTAYARHFNCHGATLLEGGRLDSRHACLQNSSYRIANISGEMFYSWRLGGQTAEYDGAYRSARICSATFLSLVCLCMTSVASLLMP